MDIRMRTKYDQTVKIFKALADENRLIIIEHLMNGTKCGCELLDALQIGQSTLSHHMRILCDAGLVEACKVGKWMHYSLSAEGSTQTRQLIDHYTLSPEKARTYPKECKCKK